MDMKQKILNAADDLISDFLYYDRKEDEDLPPGMIEESIAQGVITEMEIIERFATVLHNSYRSNRSRIMQEN